MNLKNSLLLISILLGSISTSFSQNSYPYESEFQSAYQQYPDIPKGMLEAVSYCQTRISDLNHEAPSCLGLPGYFGVMGLVLDGQNYFDETATKVANLANVHPFTLGDPHNDIMAFAKAYHVLMVQNNVTSTDFVGQELILRALSEIPKDSNTVNNYALSCHTYQILDFLRDEENQARYNFPAHNIDLISIYGEENLRLLSAKRVFLSTNNQVMDAKGNSYTPQNKSADYAPALWVATPTCNYSSRNGTAISAVTVHTIQGSYAGAISWAQNCSANVSYHYVVRSSDGQITQMVYEADKGWHVGSENPYTIGIEHEGFVDDPSWYTTALYTASAALVKDITQSGYGINPLRTFQGPATVGINVIGGCTKIKGHQHYPNQTHTDPGINWNWEYYYQLINDNPPLTSFTNASGTFYDSGGPSGNYTDDERELYLIEPPATQSVTITFNQFSLENNWDYMYIYDGNSLSAPLLGVYTGSAVPTNITSSGGAMLIEFRSDCATQDIGWEISWTSVPDPQVSDIIPPTTSVNVTGNWQTTDFTANFTDVDNNGGSGVDKKFYQVIHFDGTEWRANANNGFFSDNFNSAIHADWTQQVGTWGIGASVLNQSDELNTNTNIWANLNQDSYDQWLYHFKLKIGGAGANKRGGFHFMCDDPTQTNRGNSYFIWLRSDDDKIQIYKTVNNVFQLEQDIAFTVNDNQWYDIKTVYNKTTGEIQLFIDNSMEAAWTDTAPYTTGNSVSFRSGDANMDVDNFKVYHNRGNAELVTIGTGNDVAYQNPDPLTPSAKIKSIAIDSALNISDIIFDFANVDWTPPTSIAQVNDGTGADINTTTTSTQLSANWTTSGDVNSDLARYWYAVGTSPLATDVAPWTDNWFSDTLTLSGLNLSVGTTYYTCVYSENGAGLYSDTVCSDGQTLQAPTGSPTADFIVPNSYICSYEAVQVQNSSLDAISYSWSAPGATPSTSTDVNPVFTYTTTGYYDITLTATGTAGTDTQVQTIFVNIDTVPTAAFTPSALVVDISNPFVSFANQSQHANGYNWDFDDGNISNDVNPWHEFTATGDYYVELIAVNGLCPNDTTVQMIQVIDNLGVSDEEIGGVEVYPNPASDNVNLSLDNSWSDKVTVTLLDTRSRVVYTKQCTGGSTVSITLNENVEEAVYFLRISDGKKTVIRKILVKPH
ncbi:MAG: N-acetylmuramoyl-L-alanine amidase [Crocinitomicaceae bacterium]|nr:N-acetylmuramoyl-L-alanine amidase [Crocinitomicaceae bacterium]